MSIRNSQGRMPNSAPILLRKDLSWHTKGNCYKTNIDFYLDDMPPSKKRTQRIEELKSQYCIPCPVRVDCLTDVVDQENRDKVPSSGIAGGT